MARATLTSKGQLTLPKEIREHLGLKPGDRVVFEVEEGGARLRIEKRRALEELKGSLPAKVSYPGKSAERKAARSHVVREALGEETL